MNEFLNESNFLLFAAQHYDNPQCFSEEEFHEDLNRFKYLKRLLKRYAESGDLKERLILNHIIILYNVFGTAATQMLFFKLGEYQHILKPFLILLGYMPEIVKGVGPSGNIKTVDVSMDTHIVQILRKI